ncbi:MAG: 6-bladed beta-propeller, partial [Elusimicrobia bacterium]|nr:6-bladed beta-propeller [Elusimicrobiota bacterium]
MKQAVLSKICLAAFYLMLVSSKICHAEGYDLTATWGGQSAGAIHNISDMHCDSLNNMHVIMTHLDVYSGHNFCTIKTFNSEKSLLNSWDINVANYPYYHYLYFPKFLTLTVDPLGNTFILNGKSSNNSIIQKYGNDKVLIKEWGNYASGQLDYSMATAVDSSGNMYVTNFMQHSVVKADSNGNIIAKWGGYGTADGQFDSPSGLIVDAAGNVYVADSSNQRIQKFDLNGNFIAKWGSEGTGDGEFNSPHGISIDLSNNVIYVSDTGNSRIQKFDLNGNFIAKWKSYINGNGKFESPKGVVTDSSGNVYVADPGNNCIQKFDTSGNFLAKWEIAYPEGIAIDSADNLYVTEPYKSLIQKYDANGNFLAKWSYFNLGNGQFDYAADITLDSANNVYVVDYYQNRVQKFDSDGNFIKKWGTAGVGEGEFSHPNGIVSDLSGNIYVTDTGNYRIQKFTAAGAFVNKWGAQGNDDKQFNDIIDIAIDSTGVYVLDRNSSYRYRLQKFDTAGNIIMVIKDISASMIPSMIPVLAVDAAGNIYISAKADLIKVLKSDGSFKENWAGDIKNGEFSNAYKIAVSKKDTVFVADTGALNIQVFDATGKFITKWGSTDSGMGSFNTISDIEVDSSGNIYIVDSDNKKVQKYTENGVPLVRWEFDIIPDLIAIDTTNNMYVFSAKEEIIRKFNQNGALVNSWGNEGIISGDFNNTKDLIIDASGNLCLLVNNHIEKYDSTGKRLKTIPNNNDFSYSVLTIAIDQHSNIYTTETNYQGETQNRIQKYDPLGNHVTTINQSYGHSLA